MTWKWKVEICDLCKEAYHHIESAVTWGLVRRKFHFLRCCFFPIWFWLLPVVVDFGTEPCAQQRDVCVHDFWFGAYRWQRILTRISACEIIRGRNAGPGIHVGTTLNLQSWAVRLVSSNGEFRGKRIRNETSQNSLLISISNEVEVVYGSVRQRSSLAPRSYHLIIMLGWLLAYGPTVFAFLNSKHAFIKTKNAKFIQPFKNTLITPMLEGALIMN